jgi:hypothetical protein
MPASDPPTGTRWLSRTPDPVLWAVLGGTVAWAAHMTVRVTVLETKVDAIYRHTVPADEREDEYAAR